MRFETTTRGLGNCWHPGLGANQPTTIGDSNYVYPSGSQLTGAVNLGSAVANQTGSAVAGAVAAGLSTAAAVVTPACPPCGAALALGAALTGIVTKMLQGCGQTCVAASDAANQAEPLLQQNLSNYVNAPVRYASLQQNALANFNIMFQNLQAACQQVGGPGGTNCIKDRVAGACHWKATPWKWNSDGTFTPAGSAGSGSQCWNWVYGYHDPIAQDPFVVPDPVNASTGGGDSIANALTSLFGSGGGGVSSPSPLLLIAGLVLVYLVVD